MARRLRLPGFVIRQFEAWGEQWCLVSWWETPPDGWEPARSLGSSTELLRVATLSHGGRSALQAHRSGWRDADLIGGVAQDLESGQLALHRRVRRAPALHIGLVQTVEPALFDSAPAAIEPTLTFVELSFTDLTGEPLANERFELILPDGSKRRGTLDESGWARVNDVARAGRCELRFLDVDETYWQLEGKG